MGRAGPSPRAAARSSPPPPLLLHLSALVVLFWLAAAPASAVEDGNIPPPSWTKWGYGVVSFIFVYLLVPYMGRDGVDPVIAFTVCWTIIGCWTLYGIAN